MQRFKLILFAIILELTFTKVSRRAVARVLTVYFFFAVCFGVYQFNIEYPSESDTAKLIGGSIGLALVTFVPAGVIPLIIWALCRFRERNTVVPLLLWLVFGVTLAAFEHTGSRLDREAKL